MTSGVKPGKTGWTDDEFETLKRCWALGISAGNIVRDHLPEKSRNSVISKVHRSGLDARPSPITRPYEPKEDKRRRKPPAFPVQNTHGINCREDTGTPRGPRLPALRKKAPEPSGKVSDFATCQYPFGEKLNWSHCGAQTLAGSNYCAEHHRRCTRVASGATA